MRALTYTVSLNRADNLVEAYAKPDMCLVGRSTRGSHARSTTIVIVL